MSSLAVTFPGETLIVQPWPDPSPGGHDPRSPYVEQFWLSILGPSTTFLIRHFAALLDQWPDGYEINLDETARSIGLVNQTGRGSPFARALSRTVQFNVAQPYGFGIAVRQQLPTLTARQVAHLTPALQRTHAQWLEGPGSRIDEASQTRRARRLARTLIDLGEDGPTAEWQLRQWRFHPSVGEEAVAWALQDRGRPGAA
jgi:hypothetical protein